MPLFSSAIPTPSDIGFSKEQGQLVKQTWLLLKNDAGHVGMMLFMKVFEIAPSVIPMFSFLKDSKGPLEENPRLKAHARTVFTLTAEAAVQLSDELSLDALRPRLIKLGDSHVLHKVRDEHFDVLRFALLCTLQEALGVSWTPQVKAAWGAAYDALTAVIKQQMHSYQT